MGFKPRANARQIGHHRTATASHRLDSHQRQALKKRRQHKYVRFAIGLNQIVLGNLSRKLNRRRALGGFAHDALVFFRIAVTAHQANLDARGVLAARHLVQSGNETLNAFLVADFAHIKHAARIPFNGTARFRKKLLGVVARPNNEHLFGTNAIQLHDFAFLLFVQCKNRIKGAHGFNDSLPLQTMAAHLTHIGRMAHRHHGNIRQRFARNGAYQIQVMANNGIGREVGRSLGNTMLECIAELPRHRRREIAVARSGIRHDIRHTAHIKRQIARIETHEIGGGAFGKPGFIKRIYARNHSGRMPRREFAAHHFGQIDPAARRIGLLRRNIQNTHSVPFVSVLAINGSAPSAHPGCLAQKTVGRFRVCPSTWDSLSPMQQKIAVVRAILGRLCMLLG